jgi:hypothetical protein
VDSSKGLTKVQAGAPLEPLKYSSDSAQVCVCVCVCVLVRMYVYIRVYVYILRPN